MSMHLSEDELHDYAGGELSPERMADAAAHLDACASCRAAAEPLVALTARLAALSRRGEPAADGWPALRARLEAEERARVAVPRVVSLDAHRRKRALPAWVPRAAAAAAVFAAGFGGGRLSGTPEAGAAVLVAADTVATAVEAAARVQLAGTEYVAAVAQFVAAARGGDTLAAAMGREATVAACYGASRELTRLRGDDSSAMRLFRTAGAMLDTPRR